MEEQADKPKIVVLQGPTACGKTGLAIRICRRFQGEVVGADSLQWVRRFDIGSAKPTNEERAAARHHLIDVIEADEGADVARYRHLAREAIEEISARGMLPVVAGGTGLYVRALLGGLVDLPSADESLRTSYEALLEREGPRGLFAELERRCPEAHRHVDKKNPRRVIRALEVMALTGRPIWQWQMEHRFLERPYRSFRIAIRPEMDLLEERIAKRTDAMLAEGLVDEVRSLLRRYPDRSLKPYTAIGYAQVLDYLDGEISEEELPQHIRRVTRRYAKKQLRWLNQEEDLRWMSPVEEPEVMQELEAFLKN